nr:YbjN domain-containing protein [Jonesia denitrificans]
MNWRTLRSRITGGTRAETTVTPGRVHHQRHADASVPIPLSQDHITTWLTAHDLPYFIDSDGTAGAIHTARIFTFALIGQHKEVLHIRGRWNRHATIERAEQIRALCNDWNTTKIWPKAYHRVRDDGIIEVYGESNMDFEHGATYDQVGTTLACAIQTTTQFFDELDRHIPDPALHRP